MFEHLSRVLWAQLKAARPSFLSKTPHFNFISIHYFWIIGMSLFASVLIYATQHDSVAYIDALFFATGANTQAGLNTIDTNLLNTFNQIVLYICAMMSNPITLNGSVVFLRLYWFEKRFQHVVREARHRRATISKSKGKPAHDLDRAEKGVNGREIAVVHTPGRSLRMTNDGILLDSINEGDQGKQQPSARRGSQASQLPSRQTNGGVSGRSENGDAGPERPPPQITFADTVKRSDGLDDGRINFPSAYSNEDHLAILERQRNDDDEVLVIPGPRDAERGMKPERLRHGNDEETIINGESVIDDRLRRSSTGAETRSGGARVQGAGALRPGASIMIEEPERRRRDELADEATAIGHTLSSVGFRRPRFLSSSNKKLHSEHPHRLGSRLRRPSVASIRNAWSSRDKTLDDTPYLSWEPTLGRNSQFLDLTLEQREELGGIEYRSLRTLALVLVCYFWGFSLFALACLLPWILSPAQAVWANIVRADGMSVTWWGFFTANSAFMDLGFTLTPDSMISFNTAAWPLLIMAFLIIIGNTGFPIMLRFTIWVMAQVVPKGSGLWEELRFLLDHPRRCFTLLFPASATWWLFFILFVLNAFDLLVFCALDINESVVSEMPVILRIVNGLFQAASTRTAGFASVNLADLHPAVQCSFLIMMYISVFPIAISIRRTNVYEEKSLGVYKQDEEPDEKSAFSYVGTHLRRQLSFDLWYVFAGLFILAISEGPRIQSGDFDQFAVLFEIVSAYGTVGLSLGYPNVNASLSSQFSTVGKLVIIAMMVRGRHRGLPYGLDRAIMLPSESRFQNEAMTAQQRQQEQQHPPGVMPRSNTGVSTAMGGRRGSFSGAQAGGRGRSRTRSTERGILTQLLHPGPTIPHDHSGKAFSTGYGGGGPGADETMKRVNTEPPTDGEDERVPGRPRRAMTAPAPYAD